MKNKPRWSVLSPNLQHYHNINTLSTVYVFLYDTKVSYSISDGVYDLKNHGVYPTKFFILSNLL